jgi:hypothetical protein
MAVRVLVIEDEPAIGDFIVRGLREEGFAVECATTGTDGWRHLSTASWDVVLLDWWLPGIDGLSLPPGGPGHPGPIPDRPGRGLGPGDRVGRRGERLLVQAVCV